MSWLLEGIYSIGEGMASILGCFFEPIPRPKKRKIMSFEEAIKADSDAIRKDFESIIGKW